MDCERFLERLPDDAGLDDEALRLHLDACAGCRRLYAGLLRGRAVLRSLPSVPVTDDFVARLERRVQRLESTRRIRRSAARLAGRLATAAAAAAGGYVAVLLALGGLEGAGWMRVVEPGSGVVSVRVVRPFANLESPEVVGLFGLEPEPGGTEGAAWLPLRGVARLEGATPGSGPSPVVGYRRTPEPSAAQPVLVATPSLTFAAPPVSFQFVSARSSAPGFALARLARSVPSAPAGGE